MYIYTLITQKMEDISSYTNFSKHNSAEFISHIYKLLKDTNQKIDNSMNKTANKKVQ